MVTQLKASFRVNVTDVLDNGFIGKSEESKRNARIQDKSLLNNNFKDGDHLIITIEVIDVGDVKNDKPNSEFYVAINEFATNGGFYTKAIKEYENWKRAFLYEERGMIIFPNDDWERFEVNDIIKVIIKNEHYNI